MDGKNIALEILVRRGNPKGVEMLARQRGLDKDLEKEKTAEAALYYEFRVMWEQAEGGIDSSRADQVFSHPDIKDYFSKVNNLKVISELANVLVVGINGMIEDYARIGSIDVLGNECVSEAFKRNLGDDEIRENVSNLVENGYYLVLFNPSYEMREDVERYLTILEKWKGLVDLNSICVDAVDAVISDYVDCSNNSKEYFEEEVRWKVENLIKGTDRGLVSKLFYDKGSGENIYDKLVEEGLIDRINNEEQEEKPRELNAPSSEIDKAINEYEMAYPNSIGLKKFAAIVKDKAKEHIARKMGDWFDQGMMDHVVEVANYGNGSLYDLDIAKTEITRRIKDSIRDSQFDKLEHVLDLPFSLIDEGDEDLGEVVEAYKISKEIEERYL